MSQPIPSSANAPGPTERQHNFSAGPGVLPREVLDEIRDELPVYGHTGASVMEISHRSAAFTAVFERAQARITSLLGLRDDWHVLFLQGGATMQFHQVPLNLLPPGGVADYVNTGVWSAKAIQEAQTVAAARGATARVAASGEAGGFRAIPPPDSWDLDPEATYVHVTSNNTIYGTQFAAEPDTAAPLVCDASSDFLSRPMDVDRYGLIYAGAQKNIGPAGATAVLVRDDFLQARQGGLPGILDYGSHVGTLFNTPPVFAVYVIDKVLGWIESRGGLPGMVERNARKASLLYGAIDRTGFYRGVAAPDSRSTMNACFRLPSEDLEARFVREAAAEGLLALKGHRSTGGIRASIYNALSLSSVQALVDFMTRFEAANG
jgi:phosphoserine aminotransferase